MPHAVWKGRILEGGARPYALLREVLRETDRVGVARRRSAPEPDEGGEVVDLMELLERSVKAKGGTVGRRKPAGGSSGGASGARAASKPAEEKPQRAEAGAKSAKTARKAARRKPARPGSERKSA